MGGVMSLGVFLQPMADSVGWSRAGISTASTLAFLAVYGTAAGLAAGAVYVPLTAATASWFVRHRSLAVSLVSAGLALGTTLSRPSRAG
jgi:hypothetical protein